ncbi:MAG: membrane protein insertase YidC [bacterium]
MEKNAILAAVLALAVLLGWQYLVIRPMEDKRAEKRQRQAALKQEAKKKAPSAPRQLLATPSLSVKSPAAKAPAPPAKAPAAARAAPAPPLAEEIRVRVDTGGVEYVFTSRGAGLVSARMKDYPIAQKEAEGIFSGLFGGAPAKPEKTLTPAERARGVELVEGAGPGLRPLFFAGGDRAARLNEAAYQVVGRSMRLSPSRPEGTLRFRYRGADGLAVEKTLGFRHNSYVIKVKVSVEQPGNPEPIGITWGPRLGGAGGSSYGGVIEGPMSYVDNDLLYDYPEAGKPVTHGADLLWASLQTKYFIAALIPRAGAAGSQVSLLGMNGEIKDYAVTVPLAGGARAAADLDLYIGPKEERRMAELKVGLENSLDYGKFAFVSRPLMYALRKMHVVSRNWGIAIILLTILIKLIFYPLTHISMKNMKEMQKLQPKMKQLREIYKDDKTKMNEEVMGLYKEHKVNPMMGCLPMLIQIPVFFGLYNALLVSIELRGAPLFFWITDLSQRESPLPILTLLMGASMFLQQKMTPVSGDPSQAKMMMFMPVVFTGMFLFYPVPVGLVLYWLSNNILSVVQQYFVNRSVKAPKLAEES